MEKLRATNYKIIVILPQYFRHEITFHFQIHFHGKSPSEHTRLQERRGGGGGGGGGGGEMGL